MRNPLSRSLAIFFLTLLLLLSFAYVLNALTIESFWMDEGFSAWVVRDTESIPDSPREVLRFIRDDFAISFEHLRHDVHPPLYYLSLNAWALLVGHSEFALRLPSALLSILALAATYTLGSKLFNRRAALMAVILLATSGFFFYYSREARSYGLYLALVSLSALAAWCFWLHPNLWRAALYVIISSALLLSHYTAIPFVVAQGLYFLILGAFRARWGYFAKWFLAFFSSMAAFSLWYLAFGQEQFNINTNIEAAGALPSDLGTLAAFWLLLTGGAGTVCVIAFLLSRLNPFVARFVQGDAIKIKAISYLIVLAIVPLVSLFLANANGLAILQMRYLIAIVPLWALLLGYALSEIWIPQYQTRQRHVPTDSSLPILRPYSIVLSLLLLLWIAYNQISSYREFWGDKSDWRGAVLAANEEREALEPALVYLDERSPFAYYALQSGLLDGISINIAWREFAPQEIAEISESLTHQERVWAFVAMQAPESWDAIANLSANRGVVYRDEVQWTILYRFDSDATEQLSFNFDGRLHYKNLFYRQFEATVGEELCVPINFEVLANVPDNYSLGIHLSRGYNEVVSQVDEGLGALQAGDNFEREYCLHIPEAGNFHLRLVIYDWRNPQSRLPLFERDLLWADYLMIGTVTAE